MKQTVIAIMAAAFMTAGVLGQATQDTQRQRPQRVQLSEKQQAIGKIMAEDPEIKKIREKAIQSMIKRLVKLGHSEEDAKAVVENGAKAAERFRSGGGRGAWGNRQGGPGGRGQGGPGGRGQGGTGGDRPQRQRGGERE